MKNVSVILESKDLEIIIENLINSDDIDVADSALVDVLIGIQKSSNGALISGYENFDESIDTFEDEDEDVIECEGCTGCEGCEGQDPEQEQDIRDNVISNICKLLDLGELFIPEVFTHEPFKSLNKDCIDSLCNFKLNESKVEPEVESCCSPGGTENGCWCVDAWNT